jgi:hypothetical protein
MVSVVPEVMKMTKRERVLTTIRRESPDRVPYCELGIDRSLAQKLMGWGAGGSQKSNLEANTYSVQEAKEIASFLNMDNFATGHFLLAPIRNDSDFLEII